MVEPNVDWSDAAIISLGPRLALFRRASVRRPASRCVFLSADNLSHLHELRGSMLVRIRGGETVAAKGESGIEGQAVISPARPGPTRQGEPDTAPFKTTLIVRSASDGSEIRQLETGSDGRFRVVLPPGTYTIGPAARAGRFPRAGEQTVAVVQGRFAHVTIEFDSGMR
jgi:hypothetical protein